MCWMVNTVLVMRIVVYGLSITQIFIGTSWAMQQDIELKTYPYNKLVKHEEDKETHARRDARAAFFHAVIYGDILKASEYLHDNQKDLETPHGKMYIFLAILVAIEYDEKNVLDILLDYKSPVKVGQKLKRDDVIELIAQSHLEAMIYFSLKYELLDVMRLMLNNQKIAERIFLTNKTDSNLGQCYMLVVTKPSEVLEGSIQPGDWLMHFKKLYFTNIRYTESNAVLDMICTHFKVKRNVDERNDYEDDECVLF